MIDRTGVIAGHRTSFRNTKKHILGTYVVSWAGVSRTKTPEGHISSPKLSGHLPKKRHMYLRNDHRARLPNVKARITAVTPMTTIAQPPNTTMNTVELSGLINTTNPAMMEMIA